MVPTRRLPWASARLVILTLAAAVWLAGMAHAEPAIKAVGPIGMTVADVERSMAFYAGVLGFEKVSDAEVWGGDYERLQGVFGVRMRVVRMRLGGESIELTEYLTPRGLPVPADSRGNDRWFQHIAIIESQAGGHPAPGLPPISSS
jgi:catechol 2,3-dioxygenase-like lactoylglutathione lyase family enzyme